MSVICADDRVEAVEAQPEVAAIAGGMRFTAPSRVSFEIYSITGQRVKVVTVDSASVKVELPKGCYIVRCSQWSKKVVVK